MNVEIGAEAALFPEKKYISRIFVAVREKGGGRDRDMFATERPKIREENEGMKKRRGAAEMDGDQREWRPENRKINAGHMKSRRVRGEKDNGKKGERVGAVSQLLVTRTDLN
jgi:hypothetical protein